MREEWLRAIRALQGYGHVLSDMRLESMSPQFTVGNWHMGPEHQRGFRTVIMRWLGDPNRMPIAPEGTTICPPGDIERGWHFRKELLPDALEAFISLLTSQTPIEEQIQLQIPNELDTHISIENVMYSKRKLNQILYGPPGTGKTYRTAKLAVEICDGHTDISRNELMNRYEELRKDGRISFVTFHQSYGYEDFVEGLRPESKDGQITYNVRPGVFREVCDAARRSTEVLERGITEQQGTGCKNYVLIIDEINRANISKVFGELITLLEPDKREGEINAVTVKLPCSGDSFNVPSNLYLIGTMNAADRSIALLDTALRRRFDFEEIVPDPSILKGVVIDGVNLESLLQVLNERIEVLYDRDHTIGHAFFIGVQSLEELEFVFRRNILPLLQEYFYENWSNVRRVLSDFGSGDFVCRTQRAPLQGDGDDSYSDEPRAVYWVNKQPFPVSAYKRIYGEA